MNEDELNEEEIGNACTPVHLKSDWKIVAINVLIISSICFIVFSTIKPLN